MKNTILLLGLAFLFVIPFVNADIITPGFRGISIENKITNINDFPDYVFVSVEKHPSTNYYVKLIENEGLIPKAYKLSSHSVYAIKKLDFNSSLLTDLRSLNESQRKSYNLAAKEFFSSPKAKEVLTGISTSTIVPISSTQEKIFKEYSISLTENNEINTKVQRNNLVYAYIIAPIIALALIILIYNKKEK